MTIGSCENKKYHQKSAKDKFRKQAEAASLRDNIDEMVKPK
jgi:hypothetical protein